MSKMNRETMYLFIGGILTILTLLLFMYELSVSLNHQQVSSLAYYYG